VSRILYHHAPAVRPAAGSALAAVTAVVTKAENSVNAICPQAAP
jgi:hypothetical protein